MNKEHWTKMLPLIREFVAGKTLAYSDGIGTAVFFTDDPNDYKVLDVRYEAQNPCREKWRELLPYVEAYVEDRLVDTAKRGSIHFYSADLGFLKIKDRAPTVGSREHWKVLQPIIEKYINGYAVTVGGLPIGKPNFLSASTRYAATEVQEGKCLHRFMWRIAYPYLEFFVNGKLTIDGVEFEGTTPLIGHLEKFDAPYEYTMVPLRELAKIARI